MKKIALHNAVRLLYPSITVLVTTRDGEGMSNAAPYCWIAPVSFNPPMIYLGIQKRQTWTFKNIRETKEFCVNIVDREWGQKAVDCEGVFEKNADKMELAGIQKKECEKIDVVRAGPAKAFLECKLKDVVEVDDADHYLVIGEVVHAESADEEFPVLLYETGNRFSVPGKKIVLDRNK